MPPSTPPPRRSTSSPAATCARSRTAAPSRPTCSKRPKLPTIDEATTARARAKAEPGRPLAKPRPDAYLPSCSSAGPGLARNRRSMNGLSDILTVDSIDEHLAATNKKALFQQLGLAVSRRTGLPAKTIVAGLAEREKIGSTGFGGGAAIPHAKIEGLDHVVGY